jgi:hypothetical protein
MKSGSVETAKDMVHQMKDQIMALPGMEQFINTVNSDGSGCVVALVESQAISEANEDNVIAIWALFCDHLESPPEPDGFEFFANWSN